jgi:hypothetical protein
MTRTRRFVRVTGSGCRTVFQAFRAYRNCRYGFAIVRIVAALLLLVAAGLKAHQLATEPVVAAGFLESRWFLIAVVEFELFLGIWLVSALLPRATRFASIICFSVFACVSLLKALSGAATCGCFGSVAVNPMYTSALDFAMVLLLVYWHPGEDVPFFTNQFKRLRLETILVLVVWLAVGVPVGIASAGYRETTLSDAGELVGNGERVILEPEKWVGKRFPLLDYIDIGESLKNGKWIVVLYHHDCPKCQRAIEDMSREILREGAKSRLALVEVAPYGDVEARGTLSAAGVALGRLSEMRDWFITTPTKARLEDGVVIALTAGSDSTARVAANQQAYGPGSSLSVHL